MSTRRTKLMRSRSTVPASTSATLLRALKSKRVPVSAGSTPAKPLTRSRLGRVAKSWLPLKSSCRSVSRALPLGSGKVVSDDVAKRAKVLPSVDTSTKANSAKMPEPKLVKSEAFSKIAKSAPAPLVMAWSKPRVIEPEAVPAGASPRDTRPTGRKSGAPVLPESGAPKAALGEETSADRLSGVEGLNSATDVAKPTRRLSSAAMGWADARAGRPAARAEKAMKGWRGMRFSPFPRGAPAGPRAGGRAASTRSRAGATRKVQKNRRKRLGNGDAVRWFCPWVHFRVDTRWSLLAGRASGAAFRQVFRLRVLLASAFPP